MVIGIITVLMGLVLAAVSMLRKQSQSVRCISNLRQIHAAFQHYITDNGRVYPDPGSQTPPPSWERVLYDGNYVPDSDIFRCPADDQVYPKTNSSYDWRDTGEPSTTLAGKALTDVNRGDYIFAFEIFPEFHAKKRINVVMADGSAMEMLQNDWLKDVDKPIRAVSGKPGAGGPGPVLNGQ